MVLKIKNKFIILITFLAIQIVCFAEIKIYNKKYIGKDTFLYTTLNMNTIFGKLYRNDEVIVLKEITYNNNLYFLVKTEYNKHGIIKDVLVSEPYFDAKITFNSSTSSLIYNLKNKIKFKDIKPGENFIIEKKPRAEDNNFIYYYTNLKFFIKLSKFDNYTIEDFSNGDDVK